MTKKAIPHLTVFLYTYKKTTSASPLKDKLPGRCKSRHNMTTEHGFFNHTTAEVVRLKSTSFLSFSLGGGVPLKLPYLIGLGT